MMREFGTSEQFAELSVLYRTAPVGLALVDSEMRYIRVNDKLAQSNGLPAAEHIGKTFTEIVPDMAPVLESVVRRVFETGTPVNEIEISGATQAKSGEKRDWLVSFLPLRMAGGVIRGVTIVMLDITSRKQTERNLVIQKAYFEQLVEAAPEAIAFVDMKNVVLRVNREFTRFFGYEPAECIGKNLDELVVPKEKRDEGKWLDEEAERGAITSIETVRQRKDGSRMEVSLLVSPVNVAENQLAVYCIYRDITRRKQVERDLLAAEARFRLLVEQLPAITYMAEFGAGGKWSYVSPQIEAILGFTPSEWTADPHLWYQRLHPDDALRVIDMEERCRASGQPYSAEYRLQARNGQYRWFSDIATRVKDAHGVESLQGVMTDVTETKMMEAQFRQSQKMEAVGQLAGGIAHDFNNLLMVIRGHTDLLLNSVVDNPRDKIAQIQKAADRAAGLTRQLLAFSRMQVLQLEVIDLNRVAVDMAGMIERLFASNIELVFETEANLGRVRADEGQIEQVLLNLAVNARDAMPNGGQITIRTENVRFERGDARPLPAIGDGEYAALIVKDTGEGMDAATQARIFEPFFTTKEKGRGTGLGLATVYGIVKQSGGFIVVDSTPGRGTAFSIYLPRVDADEKIAEAETSSAPERHEATILVVDDETQIRDLAADYLTGCGFTVLTAGSGAEARDLVAKYEGPVHLLLTDTVMPNMTGRELVQSIVELRPEIKVIYMSGYLEFNASAHLQAGDGTLYIQKPFGLDALAKMIKSALEAAPMHAPK